MLRKYQIDIIRAVYKSWLQGYKRPCIVAPCGSGKTVIASELAKLATDVGERVLFLVHRKEIRDQTETTFRKYGVDMKLCTVGMVQTIVNRKALPPGLIIMDENHHVYAASYIRILDTFPGANVVGLTATPVRLIDGGLGKINDSLVIGPSVAELIELGHLAPFRYFSHVSAETSMLQVQRGEFVAKEVNRVMAQQHIYGDAVKNYKKYGLNKTIVYCSGITTSISTMEAFKSARIPAAHVDGKTPKTQRESIMEAFRVGRIKVLCNVDIVSEGFDVPDCDSVILLRPTMSLTLHIQQSMRCMRPMPGKTAVIVDMVENFTRHGLPDMPRDWSLEYVSDEKKGMTVTCENCDAVYNVATIICELCGWNMKHVKCRGCGKEQQFGFGECVNCDCDLSNDNDSWSRRERQQVDAELQEIKSFIFKGSSSYQAIDKLRRIQKAKGYDLNWTYDAYKRSEI